MKGRSSRASVCAGPEMPQRWGQATKGCLKKNGWVGARQGWIGWEVLRPQRDDAMRRRVLAKEQRVGLARRPRKELARERCVGLAKRPRVDLARQQRDLARRPLLEVARRLWVGPVQEQCCGLRRWVWGHRGLRNDSLAASQQRRGRAFCGRWGDNFSHVFAGRPWQG